MTFSTIVYKNLKYNLNRYISFYLVNSFIVAVLFMYGTLFFNDTIPDNTKGIFNFSFVAIVLFCIIFISYTQTYFVKFRGKEFGVYLTLGMTTRDLKKMLRWENLIIISSSLLTGIVAGLLFSRMFYLILGKVLVNIEYSISFNTFLLTVSVFLPIFIISTFFTERYLTKLSIIEVIQSSAKKEIAAANPITGVLAIIVFAIAMYLLPKVYTGDIFDGNKVILTLCAVATFVGPLFIISTLITVLRSVIQKYPRSYNKNLLVLSNLAHRFISYRTILYVVTLMVSLGVFLIGTGYTIHKNTVTFNDLERPYDFMFVENDKYNHISQDEIRKVIEDNGGEIKNYAVLDYLSLPIYKMKDGKVKTGERTYSNSVIISESNYNQHTGSNKDIQKGYMLDVFLDGGEIQTKPTEDIMFLMNGKSIQKPVKQFDDVNFTMDSSDFFQRVNSADLFTVPKGRILNEKDQLTNLEYTNAYSTYHAYVVDDKDYEIIKINSGYHTPSKYHLINLSNGDQRKIFAGILDALRKVNHADETIWKNKAFLGGPINETTMLEAYRPFSKIEKVETDKEVNGVFYFSMAFLGSLLLISSSIVLLYKVVTDIAEDKLQITILRKIGVTNIEMKRNLTKQLILIFFVPTLFGVTMAMYYIALVNTNYSKIHYTMMQALLVVGMYVVLQILFYFGLRKKYLSNLNE
ncbi:ABC transporter permease [Bacillus marasmi]|uniref:ABC transporter permease n=1 Tax=Bacillus marasmi TaxID=1926279 RepID=UPI0011CA3627|nr:ABC transporter permease [Bacillus marasmi]